MNLSHSRNTKIVSFIFGANEKKAKIPFEIIRPLAL